MKKVLLSILVATSLSSCASLFTSTTYSVPVHSTPEGASITILNKKGEQVFGGVTPATAQLKASSKYMSGETYEIIIKKAGYQEQRAYINSKIEGWYFGNILFGGLLGMLVIDPLTGAMYKLNTEYVSVVLEESTDTAATLQIIDINTLTDDQRDSLVKLN